MSEEGKDSNHTLEEDVSQHILTKELAMKSLDTLGFHPLFLRHAFLSMNLSHNNPPLEDISLLAQYTHLVYLDISYNQVKTLKALESIPALTQLRARGNALRECLDYSPACCQTEHAWATGHDAVGSMLTLADLRENQIESLRDLSDHFYLECLLLSQNHIQVIDGLTKLRYLQTLDLAHNKISVIEGLDNLPIRELDLSHNDILSLEGLQRLPCLSALKISHNNLTTLAPLRSMNTLTLLDVGHNVLGNIRQVEFLKEHSYLQSLVMTGNPCFEKAHYRLRVVYRLPNLKTLDQTAVSYEEKIRTHNLYRSPDGDLLLRERAFLQLFPQGVFADHSPQSGFLDEETELQLEELAYDPSQAFSNRRSGEASTIQMPSDRALQIQ